MNLRTWSRAAITAAVFSVAACDCNDESNPSTLLPSDFPGTSVEDAFLASDGRAFSESGLSADASDVQVFRNVSNNDAILTYVAETDDGVRGVWASYYNGTRFTAPVEIRGADQDGGSTPGQVSVLFLETSRYSGVNGDATSNGRGRDGDAIITYLAADVDDPASLDRDANTRVYATYFDRSVASKSAKDGIVHGFAIRATTVDFDHVIPDDMMGGADPDPSATYVGFASDSLHGTHAFGGGAIDGVLSGDPTSVVEILVYKSPQTLAATAIQPRWFAIPFDLGQEGNVVAPQASATAGVINPAVGTLENVDTVSNTVVVADGIVISEAFYADAASPAGEDRVVSATSFTGTTTSNINLGSDSTAEADATTLPNAEDVYGPDHGVGAYYAFFYENGFSAGTAGQRAYDTDLMVAQIDVGGTSRTVVEIDEFKGTIDLGDTEPDGYAVRDGGAGDVSSFETTVVRDGGLIVVGFSQPTTDATDANPTDVNVWNPAANELHRLQVVQTNRTAASLATSVLATPLRVPALVSTGAYGTTPNAVTQPPTTNFAFQIGLMNGAAAVYGGPNEVDQIEQTNENVVFFRYTQYNDASAMGQVPFQVRLFTSGISVTAGAEGSAPTATALRGTIDTAAVQFPGGSANTGSHEDWNLGNFGATVVDNFDPAGGAVTFFVSNDNSVIDAAAANSYASRRLYVWNGSTQSQVSSTGSADLRSLASTGIQVVVVKKRIHVFFREYDASTSGSVTVGTRSWSSALVATPALEEAPNHIDTAGPNSVHEFVAIEGTDRIGVYLFEGDHVFYNETRSDAAHYFTDRGLSAPTLVDNDTYGEIDDVNLFMNDGPNALSRSFFLYNKYVEPHGTDSRILVRVHD